MKYTTKLVVDITCTGPNAREASMALSTYFMKLAKTIGFVSFDKSTVFKKKTTVTRTKKGIKNEKPRSKL